VWEAALATNHNYSFYPGTLPCCVSSSEIFFDECVMAFIISQWLEEWADCLLHISFRNNCILNKS
jgi:hypothetical protein